MTSKKSVFLRVLILLLLNTSAFADVSRWRYIGASTTGERFFYDQESLRYYGDGVTAWVRVFNRASTATLGPGPTGVDLSAAFTPKNDEYPETEEYEQFQLTIYEDRTFRNGSGTRTPLAPETVYEGFWKIIYRR